MSVNSKARQPTRKAKVAFLVSFAILWVVICWLLALYEDWLVEALRTTDIENSLAILIASTALMCIAGCLLINLFGAAMTLILPRHKLIEWQQKLRKHPYALFILGKVIDYRLKPRYWTP